MHPILNDFKSSLQMHAAQLKEDLKAIRTGRATPALVEGIIVETYGGSTKLKLMEIATLTTDGPSTIVIAPFDPSTTQDIEKAILKSPLGISPTPQGGRILIKVPAMSTEQREKMTKVVGQKVEERRISIRGNRDEARKKIKALFDAKEFSEDQKVRYEKEIDTISQNIMAEIEKIRESKEAEIREV
ncbi:ribosome recycling factor [Candidatus Roizmanbacteria bacterium]|nr:ribosome recycling factor [Candidatus Roizmanbacteria bacterium]